VLEHFQPHRVGDPDLPLSDGQLDARYSELAGPVIGVEAARWLLAKRWSLDRHADLNCSRLLR
jgi:hypothetical protein